MAARRRLRHRVAPATTASFTARCCAATTPMASKASQSAREAAKARKQHGAEVSGVADTGVAPLKKGGKLARKRIGVHL